MKRRFVIAAIAVSVATAFADMAFSIGLISPQDGESVALLSDAQKAWQNVPEQERVNAFTNIPARAQMRRAGYLPQPVVLMWQAYDRGKKELVSADYSFAVGKSVVEIAEDAAFSNIVRRVVTGGYQKEIYNLKIGTRYWWRVTAQGPSGWMVSPEWSFTTEDVTPRLLKVDFVPNFRDVGGYHTLDGKRVRQGMIYRSAAFNDNYEMYDKHGFKGELYGATRVTPDGRLAAIGDLGIRTELDLRSTASDKGQETKGMTGSPLGPTVNWVNISSGAYGGLFKDWSKQAFVKDFTLFTDRANYPITFHCIAGQDRTGCLAFMLNAILGVPEKYLVLDWEYTGFWNTTPTLRHSTHIHPFLERLRKEYPGKDVRESAVKFALAVGITQEQIDKFRAIMLED